MVPGQATPPHTWIMQTYLYVVTTLVVVVVVVVATLTMNNFFIFFKSFTLFSRLVRNMKDLQKDIRSYYMHLYMAYEDVLPVEDLQV